jgi:hypothetical protein
MTIASTARVQPTGSLVATASATPAVRQGPTSSADATAAAFATIAPRMGWFRAVSASAASSGSIAGNLIQPRSLSAGATASAALTAPLVVRTRALTARASTSFILAGYYIVQLRANAGIDFFTSATIAPLKRRISTVQVVTDTTGDPRSVTGMQGTASVQAYGDQSVLTLGPASRFIVDVSATGRFSVISELKEMVSAEVGAQADLRVVQSLTTIFEEGIPALLPRPVLVEPQPEPAPATPVYGRVFYGVRR